MPRKPAPRKTATVVWKFADGRDSRQPLIEFVRMQRHQFEAMKYSDDPRLRLEGERLLRKMDETTAQAMLGQAARKRPRMHPKIAAALAESVARHKAAGTNRGTVAAILREMDALGYSVDRQTVKGRIAGK